MIGQTLGHYRVEEQLGAGGMGVVYRATDSKLGRQVAIKVLPERFASDPERLARFEREARLLAALNHPNIGAIHGFEQSGGTHYLVLELVPGPTLAERLAEGPLPPEEALGISCQIAEVCSYRSPVERRDFPSCSGRGHDKWAEIVCHNQGGGSFGNRRFGPHACNC